MSRLSIPANAWSAVLLLRHSISVQDGDNGTRTLTFAGAELCNGVREFYFALLLSELYSQFGSPEFWASEFPRAMLTAWEIFHPPQINRSMRLNIVASMTKIQGGAWYAAGKAAGKTDVALIRELIEDPVLQQDEPFADGIVRYRAFLRERNTRLTVAVGHEAHISFVAAGLIPAEQLGFNECEAVIFYLDAERNIISAEKVAPPR